MAIAAAPLAQRIKAEFDSRAQRLKKVEEDRGKESQAREERLAHFSKVCDELKAEWTPRFEEFARQFGDKIKVTPAIDPSHRQIRIAFLTDLANITLTLSASASPDVTKLVLDYDLFIIPMLFEYERYARLEMPLDRIDKEAFGKWIDDQLVSCVKAYLSIQDNEMYVKRAMVEDPVSKTRILKQDAAATLTHQGRTLYFASNENLRTYKEKHQIKS